MAKRPGSSSAKTPTPASVDTDALSAPASDYRHNTSKRKNNPPAKIAAEGTVPAVPKARYAYSPHLAPVLRFDPSADSDRAAATVAALIDKAAKGPLSDADRATLREALDNREPWLEWASKREQHQRGSFEVDPVALHIHERVSAQAILRVAARQDVARWLFADPEQSYNEAVQFYRHDIDWTNRLILGDSLQVMSSLARREDLAGKVQMIYMDPPYGINYRSNFQSEVGKRDVKDKDSDLTREPEMVKAYRDTWHLGTHSYLSYLRDRLVLAKELLADSGSIFLQISDENLHRVTNLMDEVFGTASRMAVISFVTTGGQTADRLPSTTDHVVWYCRDPEHVRFRTVYARRGDDNSLPSTLSWYVRSLQSGEVERLAEDDLDDLSKLRKRGAPFWLADLLSRSGSATTQYRIDLEGRGAVPHRGGWRTSEVGMNRVKAAERLQWKGNVILFRRFRDDFWLSDLSTLWTDTQQGGFRKSDKHYVVQTPTKVIERCLLMTTDPGDLVLDPTCGGGTTALVAEETGRRWITIDTSRVAVAIARQRLLTARFDYFALRPVGQADMARNPTGTWLFNEESKSKGPCTFKCRSLPQITLKGIAQNTNLDPIFARHEPILDERLKDVNVALARVADSLRSILLAKLGAKARTEGKRAVTDGDRRRWSLPKGGSKWQHWEVPFEADPDWPKDLQDEVTEYRAAWRAKMDEVNACIEANAEPEELVDQPEIVKGVTRVSGPFTVEAVQPPEISLSDVLDRGDGPGFAGEPEELGETFAAKDGEPVWAMRMVESRGDIEAKNALSYLKQMFDLLRKDGVRFLNNKQMQWTRLDPLFESGSGAGFHAEGRWTVVGNGADADPNGRANVVVVFGPQYGPITAKMVEEAIREANIAGYQDLVLAGFSFDGAAQAVIDSIKHPKVRIHMAHIRPDVNPGMNGLLKEQPGSQLFTVFGQPRVKVTGPGKKGSMGEAPTKDKPGEPPEGEYTATMEGVDIYDPVTNQIVPTKADKVAAWFLDSDYDGRTFCITQAFFPDRSAWEKLSKALSGVVDPDRFEALSGTTSLPFPKGKHASVAVKVIDPRGNEVMKVVGLV